MKTHYKLWIRIAEKPRLVHVDCLAAAVFNLLRQYIVIVHMILYLLFY